ncbi:Oxidative stress-induced growth inhibitor 2 [Linnemannia hyalina]|uniref:Oxidative stress-induced growth inhibitor 2 n=1 Tax=Linnemannia hyalina TaxID=64524 RepID=A0A9P7XM67_9FUNG|nr:Oxidative stress-induced growth inhibitor 2 [Linnemannia hyalina]
MFDSLAHPQLDTHRGEYPTFLEWRQSTPSHSSCDTLTTTDDNNNNTAILDSPPPTPTLSQNQNRNQGQKVPHLSTPAEASTARPHIVLGRGDVGGIWADMGHDHNQTLSYNEHMELPLYSFADFFRDNPEHDKNLERPLRSTVSAYYKAHVLQTGIQSNFSNYTTVTGIYHLKDMERHCCCGLDPRDFTRDKHTGNLRQSRGRTEGLRPCQSCAPYRYVVLGHVDPPSTRQHGSKSNRTRFMIRAKSVVLATGTFDQPKKLPAAEADPCALPASPTAMIQQSFHDTRQLEEWMKRHDGSAPLRLTAASPPPSPSSSPSKPLAIIDIIQPTLSSASTLPIVIVGTGLSAADAILLIHEKQPWRRVIHIYKHFSASEPSPLKRCHRDVYPEYNSIWMRMKRFATLKNSVQSYHHPKEGEQPCRVFGNIDKQSTCEPCKQLLPQEDQDQGRDNMFAPLCAACSYKGLPDASVSSWDPVTGQIVLVLSHGVVIQEQVAAVGVFIGKQVHMGFLKGSLAQEMLSSSPSSPLGDSSALGLRLGVGEAGSVSLSGRSTRRKRSSSQAAKELAVDIPTPPCTPPRSPTLRPMGMSASTTTARQQFWHKQALECLHRCRTGLSSSDTPSSSALKVGSEREETSQESEEGCSQDEQQDVSDQEEEEEKEEDEQTDPSQVLTLLKPLVSDMYNFRLIPTSIAEPVVVHQRGATIPSSPLSVLPSSGVSAGTAPMTLLTTAPTFPTKAKRCTRLPCYPIRRPSIADSTAESSSTAPENESTEIATATTITRAATIGDEARGEGGSLSDAASRVGKNIMAMSSACISMPCSPLLGSRIVCPTLPTPPLFSLYAAAANALTNSMAALTPRCSLISASVAAFNTSTSSPSSSSSVLSSRRSSRCSRSSSMSSLALSTITSLDSSNGAVAASAAVADGTQAVAAIGVADVEPTGGAATVAVTATIARKGVTEEERQPDYSHDDQDTSEDGLTEDVVDEDDDEEEDELPYPPPATPAEKLIEPCMDHSIYAAGAITGSKFVRYVLGNGVAIVADILRSETI